MQLHAVPLQELILLAGATSAN